MVWEGEPSRAVITQRTYPTEIEDLWDAIVTPERLSRWFLPITGDLREGGRYQLEGNAGGTITQCKAPNLVSVTWEMFGDIGWLNVNLEALGNQSTRLTLEHIAHETADTLQFWDQYGPGALGVGWDLGLSGLPKYLASADDFNPEVEETWVASAEGRDFIRSCSDEWVAAALAYGTDSQQAQEAGDRTVAFYTGDAVE
ncbi:MAG: polyketide cyclase [Pseudomonadales bacterium]|nr:polyketide cyclase [Pseudomonadales bacterium]